MGKTLNKMGSQKSFLTLLGFIFLLMGVLGIILSMVGLTLRPLFFLDHFGALGSFLFKLFLVVLGIILMYLSKVDFTD